ncbi:Glycogen debranching enzyme [Folsomia candida]|uniref:Glycogen debranching enzyme n=1 Tax=Folsomia candida TaxID=158441 RepID=A0A226E175_FOLCA|nr:Glycogen debranching enzyme [Folsomia candida]
MEKTPAKEQPQQIRVIQLEERNTEDVVYRVEKGTILKFRLSTPLHGHAVELFCNHPTSPLEESFARETYHKVDWVVHKENEETFTSLTTLVSGCFQFYVLKDGKKSGRGYFLVDPVLRIGSNDEVLALDSICCQSFFPKSLGPLSEWKGRLEVAHQSGYNMIHFTPVQELGKSNSSYSISNQLALNPIFGNVKFDDVQKVVNDMKQEWGVLSICDVVFNHTANETPWLKTNPESGYNLVNSPHLRPAYLLDSVLSELSRDISQEKYAERGLPSKINSEDHLNVIRALLKDELLPNLKIQEVFLVNVDELVDNFSKLVDAGQKPNLENLDDPDLKIIQDPTYRRFKSTVDLNLAVKMHFWEKYFVNVVALEEHQSIAQAEKLLASEDAHFVLAHNGWVIGDDPLRNFAEAGSNIYLRRELIVWSDSVKLRFGPGPSYCPFLWDVMKKYVETTATVFHGLRLDNCHSTPIHLAEYLLDAARNVRPDLFVVAELFTNSDRTDNIFVNRLGITSLIRGCYNFLRVRRKFSLLGKFLFAEAMSAGDSHEQGRLVYRYGGLPVGTFVQEPVRPMMPSIAHALMMDQTHDNPSPITKRSVYDVLPTAAMVSMAGCATGSNRGLDEFVPHHIHVVHESRFYSSWSSEDSVKAGVVSKKSGIISAKKVLNKLHMKLGQEGFSEVFVDQMDYDIVAVTRHHPTTHARIVLVTYTAFSYPGCDFHRTGNVKDLAFEGVLEDVLFEARLKPSDPGRGNFPTPSAFEKDGTFINAVQGFECVVKENFPVGESKFVKLEGNTIKINPPSSVTEAVVALRELICKDHLKQTIAPMTFNDLNTTLYKCEEEEKNFSGFGLYNIPNFGTFVYAGLQGIHSTLADVRLRNDTGHPICDNLRAGDCFVQNSSPFVKALSLGSVQCCGLSLSGPLPNLSPNLVGPKPSMIKSVDGHEVQDCGSLCAGLPHFSTGYMRNWGRDTFISLPGLLILTGRHADARNHILAYASVLRHGLIPNLLDRGTNSRYNCRDATWFWLQAIKIYVENVPFGEGILKDRVSRMWPNDFGGAVLDHSVEQSLEDVMHETLQRHFEGISFRERNAGNRIDGHMQDEGFNVVAGVDLETGFVYGGNAFNCGTWMDKMGSSDNAGVRGVPATPRDGSAVELVGLSASVLKFLAEIHSAGKYSHSSVQRTDADGKTITWTLSEWNSKIQKNFESKFWIAENPSDRCHDPHENLINRSGIYKDSYRASSRFCDYQLRPNFLIAMAVAPHLFTPSNAIIALGKAKSILLSELGMRTLDPSDWNYDGNYDNSNDSADRKKSDAIRHVRRVISKHWRYVQASPWKGLPELTNLDGAECWGSCRVQAWSMATMLEVIKDLTELEKHS